MDAIGLVREQRDQFAVFRSPQGIDAVLKHLDAAINHFQTGRRTGEPHLFTDVIYRSNQVFEGILKEAFAVLADQPPAHKKPFEIETFFAGNNIFKPRVIDYFTRYRKDWRNASTHDYQLDFDEQEAFLAIATVSAFCFVAMGQMLQRLASNRAAAISHPLDTPPNYGTLAATIVAELPNLVRQMMAGAAQGAISEMVMRGAVEGLIKSLWRDNSITVEPSVEFEGEQLRPDLVWQGQENTIVIEIKSTSDVHRAVHGPGLRDQLMRYIQAVQASAAIGIVVPRVFPADRTPVFGMTQVHNVNAPMIIIHPVQD